MKSAYEIAMAKLNKAGGEDKQLTDEQKARIAEIDRKYEARIAGARMGLDERLAAATSAEEVVELRAGLADEIRSLEEKCQRDKDAVWNEA